MVCQRHIRFYAGAPLRTKDGYNLGSLCVADMQPHPSFTRQQRNPLTGLAYFVMELLESRLVTQVLKNELVVQGKDITDSVKRFHLFAQHSKDIIVVFTISDPGQADNPIIYAGKGFERLTGFLIPVLRPNLNFAATGGKALNIFLIIKGTPHKN